MSLSVNRNDPNYYVNQSFVEIGSSHNSSEESSDELGNYDDNEIRKNDSESTNEGVPNDFKDPFTLEPITNPILLNCGHFYERDVFLKNQVYERDLFLKNQENQGKEPPIKCFYGCQNVKISEIVSKQLENGLFENLQSHRNRNTEIHKVKRKVRKIEKKYEKENLDQQKINDDLKLQLSKQITQDQFNQITLKFNNLENRNKQLNNENQKLKKMALKIHDLDWQQRLSFLFWPYPMRNQVRNLIQ